ncbi:unnamed protein product [Rhizoctonia solani]|uniref:Uncharacterized protein n=1 Tax=Rhizoctonia solani TaxID=456999 RepID=A0A8H3ECY8_9AGAM|nr:unnamed protein product [Rhizoctonia solani]
MGGSSSSRNHSNVNTSYAPLSQPQTHDYLNYPTTSPSDFGAHPTPDDELWPFTATGYGWANGPGAPEVPPEGFAGYPSYPLHGTIAGPPPSYPGPYAYTSTNEPWPDVFSGHSAMPSPPPQTLNPQVLHQSPPTQRTRRQRSPHAPQASSSSVRLSPPTYRIVQRGGRNILECLCGCGRTYRRENEWARAHEDTETSCSLCGCRQSRLDSLRRHMRAQHGMELDSTSGRGRNT